MRSTPSPPPTRRQQAIGVTLVLCVAMIWVASAELIQYIFSDPNSDYDKPYALTYVSLSQLSLLLLGFLRPSWRKVWKTSAYESVNDQNVSSNVHEPQAFDFAYIVKFAALLAPPFFLCMWTFNAGLDYTSVASSSIIATLTSLFTLVFGAITGVERFSYPKLGATVMCIAGVSLIVAVDDGTVSGTKSKSNPVLGDMLSVLSAALYASYAILIKQKAGSEGKVSMPMVLGIMGTFIAIFTWPGVYIVHLLGIESFQWPSKKTILFLLINGLIGTVLSEVMWAVSIVLTTPMTTTLSLSMTVPLSLFCDKILNEKTFSREYIVGALLVIAGFIVTNVDVASSRKLCGETNGETLTEREP